MINILQLYGKTRDAAHRASDIVTDFRFYNLDAGIRMYRSFLTDMQWILQSILQNKEQLEEIGISAQPEYVMQMMQSLLEAQEQQDYVLLADLLELQTYPFLTEILELIRQSRPHVERVDYLEQNLEVLKEQNPELCRLLREHRMQEQVDENGIEQHYYDAGNSSYHIELTSAGYFTCRVERGEQSYYLHSNGDPLQEAQRWLSEMIDEEAEAYHILGIGLGHHAKRLHMMLNGNYPVHVYEPDLNMLWIALKHTKITDFLQRNLYLHYDPDLRQLTEAIGMQKQKLCIHYPSMRGIGNRDIRSRYEQFFIQESSYRNAKLLLQGNFDMNMKGFTDEPERIRLIDELKERFHGKRIFIIAAGPSLDKNIHLLKELNDPDSLIISTGTVFHKLLQMEIIPDYVIVTDANERVVRQIHGAEDADVPMLMLSTANHKFMSQYRAMHYIIFQEGYYRAEEKASALETELYQTGGSVSTTALDAAIRLGASQIVFLGLDLAFTDNLAHAEGTSNRIATDTDRLTAVRAQNGGTVYADHKFIIYRKWIERRLKQSDTAGIAVINATEGGSYIEGMKHMPLLQVLQEP